MDKTTVIIVDDEAHHREKLQERLERLFPQIHISAVCVDADEALLAIARYAPKLVFLDVEMPGKNGFEFLNSLNEIRFEVIFTTSHAAYAVQAFRVAAVDFLLKPYGEEQLQVAVERFIEKSKSKNTFNHVEQLLANMQMRQPDQQKIALPTSTGYIFRRIDEIIRLEAQNTYTTFFMTDKHQVVVSRTMKDCEEMMRDYNFLRVHQSHMINLAHIKRYIKGEGGTVEMDDGSQVEVSRRKKEEFLEALKRV